MQLIPSLESIRRQRAANSLLYFIQYTKPDYQAGWFHAELCRALEQFYEDVKAGLSPRLIIAAPPRHGKSEIVSRRFPAWVYGKDPDMGFLGTSYGNTLAVDMCRDVQRIIDGDEYRVLFPSSQLSGKNVREISLGSYKRTSDEFEIVGHKGRYIAAGVGQGITGKGADIGIIDDPVKDAVDADSITIQVKQWDWYTKTFRSRIAPGGGILFIGTRWNVNDLGGQIIANEGLIENGGKWKLLSYPAIAIEDGPHRKAGEALHPERWPLSALEEFKTPQHAWESLYQQSPFIRGGNMIKREWIQFADDFPRQSRGCRYWDLASSVVSKGNSDPDYTVGARVHVQDGQYFIVGIERFRNTPMDTERRIAQTAELDGRYFPIWIQQDPGQAGKSQIDYFARNVLAGYAFKGHNKGQTGKVTMAEPFAAAAEAGNVFVVRKTHDGFGLTPEQIKVLLDEIELFPSAPHDDQVDGITGALDRLTQRQMNIPKVTRRM